MFLIKTEKEAKSRATVVVGLPSLCLAFYVWWKFIKGVFICEDNHDEQNMQELHTFVSDRTYLSQYSKSQWKKHGACGENKDDANLKFGLQNYFITRFHLVWWHGTHTLKL